MRLLDLVENYRDDTREKYSVLKKSQYDNQGNVRKNSSVKHIDPSSGEVVGKGNISSYSSLRKSLPKSHTASIKMDIPGLHLGQKPKGEKELSQIELIVKDITTKVKLAFVAFGAELIMNYFRDKIKTFANNNNSTSGEYSQIIHDQDVIRNRSMSNKDFDLEIYNYVKNLWKKSGKTITEPIYLDNQDSKSFPIRYDPDNISLDNINKMIDHFRKPSFKPDPIQSARRKKLSIDSYDDFRKTNISKTIQHFVFPLIVDLGKTYYHNSDSQQQNVPNKINSPSFNIPHKLQHQKDKIYKIYNLFHMNQITFDQAIEDLLDLGLTNNMSIKFLNS